MQPGCVVALVFSVAVAGCSCGACLLVPLEDPVNAQLWEGEYVGEGSWTSGVSGNTYSKRQVKIRVVRDLGEQARFDVMFGAVCSPPDASCSDMRGTAFKADGSYAHAIDEVIETTSSSSLSHHRLSVPEVTVSVQRTDSVMVGSTELHTLVIPGGVRQMKSRTTFNVIRCRAGLPQCS